MTQNHYPGTTYRCQFCKAELGHDHWFAQDMAATFHGHGKCVSACQYCADNVPHSRDVCGYAFIVERTRNEPHP